jgi:hypothetical protein
MKINQFKNGKSLLEHFVELLGLGILPSACRRATISCIHLASNIGSFKVVSGGLAIFYARKGPRAKRVFETARTADFWGSRGNPERVWRKHAIGTGAKASGPLGRAQTRRERLPSGHVP